MAMGGSAHRRGDLRQATGAGWPLRALLALCLCALCLEARAARASFTEELFFVGEDVEVLTIASKHPERPEEAPAVAQVITAREIREGGFRTLAELLRTLPGLWVEERGGGFVPCFRGVPEGFLLLYDGVPLTTDSTKTVYQLGEELSLEGVARVEIIRGPGSVLWGPDAFAGVVNVVPRREGPAEGTLLLGSPRGDASGSLFLSGRRGEVAGSLFLSAYGREPLHRTYDLDGQEGTLGRSEFYDLHLDLRWRDQVRLSGRFSHSRRQFVLHGQEGSWPGTRENPTGFLKLALKQGAGGFVLRGNFYYQYLYLRERELSLSKRQRNHLLYGELLVDRELADRRGLLTLGASWRRNVVRDATWRVRGYLPAYLDPTGRFPPLVDTADFETDLRSVFGQVRWHLRLLDLWAGLRLDDHDQYDAASSFQLGALARLRRDLVLKLIYGTAYRTPYSAQFLGRDSLDDPEEIRTLTLELRWQAARGLSLFVSPYYNRVRHHVSEDPFGGYSRPLSQEFLGAELGFTWRGRGARLSGAFSWLNHWGDEETYRVLDYIIILPGEEPEKHYSWWDKPFLPGPRYFGHLDLSLRLAPGLTLFSRLSYVGPRRFALLAEGEEGSFSPFVRLDLTLRWQRETWELSASLKNLTDEHYAVSGPYGPEDGERFGAFLTLRRRW